MVRLSQPQGEHGLANSLASKAAKQYANKKRYVGNREHVENICRGDDWDSQACVVHQEGEDGKHERNNKDRKAGRRKMEAPAATAAHCTPSEVSASASSEEAENDQKQDRANGGGDDGGDDA